MKGKLLFLLLAVIIGCTGKSNKQNNLLETAVEVINKVPVLEFAATSDYSNSSSAFTWNEISSDTQLIPLETSLKSLLTESIRIHYIDETLIILSDDQTDKLHIFDRQGKYINTIFKKGQGPDEYIYTTYIHFDKETSTLTVFDNGNQKLISYDLAGNSKKVVSTKDKLQGNIVSINKNNLYCFNMMGDYQITFFDHDLNLIKNEIPFPNTIDDRKIRIGTGLSSGKSRRNKDMFLVNNPFNDTIFVADYKGVSPLAVWKKGSKKVPIEELKKLIELRQKPNDYVQPLSIDYFSNFLLLQYIYTGNVVVELWDLNKEALCSRYMLDMNEKGTSSITGFPYEFSSGKLIDILPRYITRDKMAFIIPADKMTEEIAGLKEDDNPVIMIFDIKE